MIRLIRKQDQLYDLDHCEKLLMSFVVDQTVINPENFGEKSVDTFSIAAVNTTTLAYTVNVLNLSPAGEQHRILLI